jgi:iron complex outermembrane recepter protein
VEIQQLTFFTTDTTGAQVFLTANAGRSTNKGFEIETRWRATPNTVLHLDAQYLDAKYQEFRYTAPSGPTAPPVFTGCPTSPIAGQALIAIDCSGFRALRSPKWTLNGGIEQTIPLGDNKIVVSLDSRYQSKSVVGFEMIPGVSEQEGYFMTSASIDFKAGDGNWSVGAFVNNIENNRPIGQTIFNNQFNTYASTPYAPRTYGVRARFNW